MEITINHNFIERVQHIEEEEILKEYEVIRQAIKDPAHFRLLYDRYFTAIFSFIFRRIDDEDVTADLTSQTFYKALKGLKHYKNRGVPFSAWLYRIATNVVNAHYRHTRKRLVYSFDESEFEQRLVRNIEAEVLDIEAVVNKMRRMSDKDIEVLQLRFFEEKSFAEMAFILDINEPSAKMRTYRAIDKLKKLLKGGEA